MTVMSFLWIAKKLFEKTSDSKQNIDYDIILSMGHRKMCCSIETEPSRFPTHAYVASAKRVADDTQFLVKPLQINRPSNLSKSKRNYLSGPLLG
jgi:hypothetical protein